ncbi:MAG TPA: glycosidase [Candidatus Bathyarchaeia archaeon]|nr:glycosidase [Candidatus Bathyarchaeia archaeon]
MRIKLERSSKNPIIEPRFERAWERGATFNPGAVKSSEVVHVLYRAVNEHGISSLGHATTTDGETILSRSPEPVLAPVDSWEELGCEDPRITALDGRFYIFYTAYSRRGPRVALASTTDFSHYERYGVVGPDHDDKDAALFPQLINGKFAVVHRIEPNIEVAFFDSIKQMERISHNPYSKNYLKRIEANTIMKPKWKWEEKKVGIGPPPIRTDAGWIVIYHGVDSNTVYRAGAALLDLENPCRVIARTPEPILEPEEKFERVGVVPNVVFPEGAVVIKDELKIFYGGADKVCCIASVPLGLLIESLEQYES